MTPRSIITGRQFDSRTTVYSIGTTLTQAVGAGDANRVGVVVSIGAALIASLDGTIVILGGQEGTLTPLTVLTPGHPVCYLSVDKIGSAIFGAMSVQNNCTGTIPIGVTMIRQTQPLE